MPSDVLPRLPWDRVLLLMLLQAATAIVCIVTLTTLTRARWGATERPHPDPLRCSRCGKLGIEVKLI
jgi:hypothetical protein